MAGAGEVDEEGRVGALHHMPEGGGGGAIQGSRVKVQDSGCDSRRKVI